MKFALKFASLILFGWLQFAAITAFAQSTPAPLTTQDYVEIEQLYARYNHAIDSGNAEDWAATFTPDGVFNNRFTGREALIGFVNNWKNNGGLNRRHWNSNLLITATPQGVRGSVYLMLLDVSVKPAAVFSTGIYSDELVKTSEGWRFKKRGVKPDAAPAQSSAPATPEKPR